MALLGRDGGISLNQPGCDASHCLDGKGQRCHIQKQDFTRTGISGQLAALNGSSKRHALIRVQALTGLFSRELSYLILHGGNTRGTANQKYLADIGIRKTRILHGVLNRNRCLFNQIMGQFIEFRPCQVHIKMLGALSRSRDEGQVNVCGGCGGKLLFRFLSRFLQSLKRHLVSGQIHALRLLEFVDHPLCQLIVKVITAKTGVSVRRKNLDNAVTNLDNGNIKGTAAKVVYHDLLFLFIVKSIGKRRRRGLVDDTLYIETCDLAGILGRLTLCVIKISGNRDDSLCHLLAQIALRIRFQLLENHCGNLLRRIFLTVNVTASVRTHISFDGCDGLFRIGNRLTLCRLADQPLSGLCKRNNRGCCPCSFRIGDNGGLSTFHNRHAAVCST